MGYVEMCGIDWCPLLHTTFLPILKIPNRGISRMGDPHFDLPGVGQIFRFGFCGCRSDYRSPSLNIHVSLEPTVFQLVL